MLSDFHLAEMTKQQQTMVAKMKRNEKVLATIVGSYDFIIVCCARTSRYVNNKGKQMN